MFHALLIAATKMELQPMIDRFEAFQDAHFPNLYHAEVTKTVGVSMLFTGIGAVNTVLEICGRLCFQQYDRLYGVGIAGSFSEALPLGSVVQIGEDCLADLAIDDNGKWKPLGEVVCNPKPLKLDIPLVKGITVNTTSGSEGRIETIRALYPEAEVETMENAAFFQTCLKLRQKFCAIRAISNRVEPRNVENWVIQEAVLKLSDFLLEHLRGSSSRRI